MQGVRSVLMSVLSMLAEPNIESGANIEVSVLEFGKDDEATNLLVFGSAARCSEMIMRDTSDS